MNNQEYQLREITPESRRCGSIGGCPAVYEITSKEQRCGAIACPAVYETREQQNSCGFGACPTLIKKGDYYFIVGESVNPKDCTVDGETLEKRVGEGEALIKVPKELIDKREQGK